MPVSSAEAISITIDDNTELTSLAELLGRSAPGAAEVVVNLGALRHPNASVLLALMGWTAQRVRHGCATKYQLPTSRIGRELLRRLNYEHGFRSAVGTSLRSVMAPDQELYFESESRLTGSDIVGLEEAQISEAAAQLQDRGFFQFRSWDSDPLHPKINLSGLHAELTQQELRWSDELLISLLSRRLGRDNVGYVSSHLVYEALSNAFRHANSETIVSVEQVYDVIKSNAGHRCGILRMAFWDNGDPVQETLRKSLLDGRNVINPDSRLLAVRFEMKSNVQSNFDLEAANARLLVKDPHAIPAEDLFLAAFLPGVTSEPEGFGATYHHLLREKYPLLAAPGKGLFNMLNAVCTFLRGTLTAWSGGQAVTFMMHPSAEAEAADRFVFTVACKKLPPDQFMGNLIAIELPLSA